MLSWIENLLSSLGYVGVAFLMTVENVFPPIPSELIMPLAGFSATQGDLTLLGVIIAGTVGSVLGALPLYYLGALFGEERLTRWADRYGKWLTVSGKDVKRADDWFERHGNKVVLFARLVPGIRSLISVPAGMSKMNLGVFLLYTTLGTGLWAALLACGGWLLGDNYEAISRYLGPISYVVFAGLAVAAIVWIVRRRSEKSD